MKTIFSILLFTSTVMIAGYLPVMSQPSSSYTMQEEDDSLIWRLAERFGSLYNNSDTASMSRLLPEDFMLQWVHENFLRKKGVINSMTDSAVHRTFRHTLARNANAIIRYSDDHNAACLETGFTFLDPLLAETIKKKNGYGLCIMYFQKGSNGWSLKTVHLDLHCSLCDL